MSVIAVVGAASYEGRQLMLSLADEGRAHVGFDRRTSSKLDGDDPVERLNIESATKLCEAFERFGVTDVIHLPDRGTVAKSLKDPLDAFEMTLLPLMAVLRASATTRVNSFVLSSTASVYGTPERIPVPEKSTLRPISPLGAAAAGAERITTEVCGTQNIPLAILRYFNAAGADPDGRAGAADAPKHLITAAVKVALGHREGPLKIYGNDYDTPDGTPMRDYVHVADVALAQIAAVDHLNTTGETVILNCGYGEGASVQDVIHSVERVIGKQLPVRIEGRREGDPSQLIADTAAIRQTLGWRPRYNDLDLIIGTAIDWERKHGNA